MAKTYIAQSIGKNHDWDFSVDDDGNITALTVRAEVNYGSMGMTESRDIWSSLNEGKKQQIRVVYNQVRQWFDNQFLGE